jgi:uncharacterized membrane protein YbaN (DUF454 family)
MRPHRRREALPQLMGLCHFPCKDANPRPAPGRLATEGAVEDRTSREDRPGEATRAERRIAPRSPAVRLVYLGLGCLFVPVGAVGLVMPLLPGTVFLILAAACFARSSPRFEQWLLEHRYLGPSVRAWRANGSIPRRVKWIACLSLVASYGLVLASAAPLIGRIAAAACFIAVAVYIVTRPEPIAES